jgi:SAM-dependent methyltransferase
MTDASPYDRPDLYDAIAPADAAMESFYSDEARRRGGRVLELACGSGRLTIPLARACSQVVGGDASPAMLARARRHAAEAGLDNVDFVPLDMRDFSIEGDRFSAIVLAANSILHLHTNEDLVGLFSSVARHLEPHGTFLFDAFVPSVPILGRDPWARFAVAEGLHETLGRIWVEETTRYDPIAQVSHIDWYWSHDGAMDFWHTPLRLRQIFPQELPLLIAASGLRMVERFGDFDRTPLTGTSRRQVCLCMQA